MPARDLSIVFATPQLVAAGATGSSPSPGELPADSRGCKIPDAQLPGPPATDHRGTPDVGIDAMRPSRSVVPHWME
jgi:hypothetical protein